MANRTNAPYRDGELETILSLAPTSTHIVWLSRLLERSEAAIEIVYKIAFEHGPFAKGASTIQQRKIIAAKNRIGLRLGRKRIQRRSSSKSP
jgi:hypothetical protein